MPPPVVQMAVPPPLRSAKKKINPAPAVDLSLADPDWRWTVFDKVEDNSGRIHLKQHIKEEDPPENGPFELIYDRTARKFWPDVITISVSSAPLIRILQQYLPDHGDLKSLDKPDITGRELFILLDSLKIHLGSFDADIQSTTANQTADGNSNFLHTGGGSSPKSQDLSVDDKAPEEAKSKSLSNGESVRHASFDQPTPSVKDGVQDGEAQELDIDIGGEVPNGEIALSTKEGVNDETKTAAAAVLTNEERGRWHLRHLVRFLEEEYKDVLVKADRMREEKRVSWDMLWAFLPRGTKVVYYCNLSDEMLCGVVSANYYRTGLVDSFVLDLDVWNYNGTQYRKCQIRRQLCSYVGERSFGGLPVCPIELMGNPKQLEEGFLTNGKKFYELAVRSTHRFMQYSGPMFRERPPPNSGVSKEKADGRVMIDLASFAMMNPQYGMGNAHPGPRPPPPAARRGPTPYPPAGRDMRLPLMAPPPVMAVSESTSRDSILDHAAVTDESLIFAPAVVYGFSFALKQWGTFAVGGFKDITFDTKAFEELTMAPDMKELVHNLVSQYVVTSEGALKLERVDPIAQKGEGCVFLCYGPPGSGKTLTAESIAENLERPLWALSVAELGTTPEALEKTLMKVFDIAAIWRAVLLLDEADVYLEKRTSMSNVVRNAMTGVFLRLLEYYRGVLFLTTNRIGTFDEAFRSRISVFLRYPPLSLNDKEKVWRTLLRRGAVEGITDELCHELATRDLNGREIRNAIHTAQVWAKSKGEPLEPRHVKHVIGLLANSLDSLNQDLQISNAE